MNLNFVIIGCGLIGHKRAQNLGKANLVACVDINIQSAKTLAEKYNIPYFISIEELFSSNLLFDAAIIATPHNLLPELVKRCLENKKHVLVEKPAARFEEEIFGLEELAKKNNCKIRVGFNHRYHRAFRKVTEILDSGVLGDLMFIRGRYGHGGRVGYNKEWRANPALSGGGELIDQGSHLIDLSRMVLGNFTHVSGYACNYYWDMPVDDNAFLNLRTEDGKTAFLQVSCTEWKNTFNFEIYGKIGKLEVNGLGGSYGTEKLTFYKMLPEMGPPETYSWEYPMQDDSWIYEFQEFLKDIYENRIVVPGINDAIENLKIINKIYKDSGYDYNA
jgi:predicted dehydrogenase